MVYKAAVLVGRERELAMRFYLKGAFTVDDAARLIGVSRRQIVRDTPAGFAWHLVRRAYVEKMFARSLARIAAREARRAVDATAG